MKEAIFVDLDGCLAHYDGWKGVEHIGKPVPAMLDRVKSWIDEGKDVVIFTARISEPGAFPHIKKWLRENGLEALRITNRKEPTAGWFYDDRAVAVERNTGRILGGEGPHEDWDSQARKEIKE